MTTAEGLERLEPEWAVLHARVPDALPFVTHAWAAAWWAHLRREARFVRDSLRICIVRGRGGDAVAIAPLMLTTYGVLGAPLARIVQPIGADPNLTEVPGMLVSEEHEGMAVGALARHFEARAGEYDWLRWSGLRRGGDAVALLARSGGLVLDREISTYVLALPGTWEEFRRTRPRNVRESLRKCYNSLERDGHTWRFRALDSGADVEAALERFFDLHGRRAERVHSVPHLDYFAAPRARRFLSGLVGRLGRCGAARMFQIEVSGEVVAMRLGFRFGTNLYLYYSGYDPAWGRYSVMTTVVAEAIRHAIESGATTANLSSGADVSKTRWRPREVGYLEGVALGRGIRARLAHRSFRAAWAARRLAMGVRRRAHA